uniref:Uncharacterized protein n=1 Tax=Anguilla anguilla TaxID=7936 RepID=A0A0E9T481_ANGAN
MYPRFYEIGRITSSGICFKVQLYLSYTSVCVKERALAVLS